MLTFIRNIIIGSLLGTAIVLAAGGPEENWLETWKSILSADVKELRA